MHTGDYWGDNIDSIKCNLIDEKIDVLLVHNAFLRAPNTEIGFEKMIKYINPKYAILMHISESGDWMTKALKIKEDLKLKYPNIYIFTNEVETIGILKTGDLIKINTATNK